tara:strand:- start:3404 stop:3697 length:294 start_codon:yes stop_codon:yes gene_type:complete
MGYKVGEFRTRTEAESSSLKYFFGADSDWFDDKETKKAKVINSWRNKVKTSEPKRCYLCGEPYSIDRMSDSGLLKKIKLPHFFFNIPMQSGRCDECS